VVAINSAGGSLSGVLAGDDLQLRASGVTGSMADKHAGTGKAVSVTGLSLSGADIANYTVDNGGGLRVDITPRTLVATASAADKFYDGSNVAAVTLADDRIAGDALSLTSSGASFAGKDAGAAQTVSIGGLALTGADAGDYVLLSNTLTTTASINRAPLAVSANALSKVYGESVNLTGAEFTTLGLVAGESLGLVTLASDGTASTAPVAGSPYAIAASDARGGSFNPANYALTYNSGLLTVTPRPLTIAANSVVRTADEPNPASFGFSTSVGGLLGGDSIASVVLNAPAGSATAAGGSIFELVPSGAVFGAGQASNYALSYDSGLLVVLPRPPRVDVVDPGGGNAGPQGLAVQVDPAELARALDALQRSSNVVAQTGADTLPGLPLALRRVEATAAEISVALAGDGRRITLPALLRLPLISFDPKLRQLVFGGPATGSTPPSSTAR
jgi:YDG domain/MBG domain (YGX type)